MGVCVKEEEKKSIKEHFWKNRIQNPFNITLTEKQVYKVNKIDDINSSQNYRHFKNVLNSKVFGNGYKRFDEEHKKQLQMLVVREVSLNQRHHLHCIIGKPKRLDDDRFIKLITETWKSTNFGYDKIHIEKPSSQEREDGWLGYILKNKTKMDFSDSFDWENISTK